MSQQYCLLVFTPGLGNNNSHFDTVTDTITDMVTVQNVGDTSNLFNFLPASPVWCTGLIILTVKDDLTVTT